MWLSFAMVSCVSTVAEKLTFWFSGVVPAVHAGRATVLVAVGTRGMCPVKKCGQQMEKEITRARGETGNRIFKSKIRAREQGRFSSIPSVMDHHA